MIYLSSIKPLDVLAQAFGTPLVIEVYVLHTYQPEDWDYSFGFKRQNGIPFWGDIGTACGRGDEALSMKLCR